VRHAVDAGLDVSLYKCQYDAGKVADIETLQLAQELGMQLTVASVKKAAWAGSLSKVRWLHEEQHCRYTALSTCGLLWEAALQCLPTSSSMA
jgi:hypothetical protein